MTFEKKIDISKGRLMKNMINNNYSQHILV
ncbi:hypothetical protein XBKQ1_280006 [Xenorhabdus bovienii str. kraussei Quebec]|uniref:Uncharacterized protein n=7 Tax=Xenorhabdus bovienii TaxID=40576 RepID=A0A077P8N6_XENBV|nr:hypothetical protein XBFFR1_2470011 [Xenorhabdus bovienii str. feltiae France]CDG94955.1 hypothetical protein XBFFL1_940011 [Xenorhabdus bovienii str. feltiae Florida]CDG95241.1 hypothetical protein XBP1_1120031 [Xenorhabdus bovienii str. puntauvense]CDH01703.1 hypothetical protein XBFM1_2280036 [Xenorhabdus bovienii str. feltiae Moldova]CDH06589.1 hypothetical protein XBO1_2360011 [Xenorhabdus bovienii str. oregonense]CDH20835.1 hypothetical protein XBKQ1_280006 [Xenorhabdus bovienii str. 